MKLGKLGLGLVFLSIASAFDISRRGFMFVSTVPTVIDNSKTDFTFVTADNNNISLYGAITEQSCFQLQMDLLNTQQQILSNLNEGEGQSKAEINLHLQSPGGSLMAAFYVCDLISTMTVPVNTYIDGYVASAASLISVCGKKRYMTENSMVLIHQLSGGVAGKYNEMKDDLENSQTMMRLLEKIYIKNTNIDKIMLEKYLEQDIWWNSSTCLELGLVDIVN